VSQSNWSMASEEQRQKIKCILGHDSFCGIEMKHNDNFSLWINPKTCDCAWQRKKDAKNI
jgi:hypothetical protein